MSENETYLTPAGAEKLRAELRELTEVERPNLAQRLRQAIQMGDLSENADYITAKEEQAFLEGKILELEAILRQATIIQNMGGEVGAVKIGSTVTIAEGGAEPEVYRLVGTKEADPRNGLISNNSPIGKALLGKKTGDTAIVNTPGGKLTFKIVEILS